jgi:uncharacterized UPF0160 family protein
MVWKHHGCQFLTRFTSDPEIISQVYDKYYQRWVLPIDANDNGIVIDKCSDLPEIIGSFNEMNELTEDELFMLAVDWASIMLMRTARSMVSHVITRKSQKTIIQQSYDSRTHPEIMVMTMPITSVDVLHEIDPNRNVKFVIVPRTDDDWRIWTVSDQKFVPLVRLLPKERFADIPDMIFVHANGFTGGARSKEAAFKMAELTLLANTDVKARLESEVEANATSVVESSCFMS